MADTFAEEYKYKVPFNFTNKWRRNEYEFWGLIEDPLCIVLNTRTLKG